MNSPDVNFSSEIKKVQRSIRMRKLYWDLFFKKFENVSDTSDLTFDELMKIREFDSSKTKTSTTGPRLNVSTYKNKIRYKTRGFQALLLTRSYTKDTSKAKKCRMSVSFTCKKNIMVPSLEEKAIRQSTNLKSVMNSSLKIKKAKVEKYINKTYMLRSKGYEPLIEKEASLGYNNNINCKDLEKDYEECKTLIEEKPIGHKDLEVKDNSNSKIKKAKLEKCINKICTLKSKDNAEYETPPLIRKKDSLGYENLKTTCDYMKVKGNSDFKIKKTKLEREINKICGLRSQLSVANNDCITNCKDSKHDFKENTIPSLAGEGASLKNETKLERSTSKTFLLRNKHPLGNTDSNIDYKNVEKDQPNFTRRTVGNQLTLNNTIDCKKINTSIKEDLESPYRNKNKKRNRSSNLNAERLSRKEDNFTGNKNVNLVIENEKNSTLNSQSKQSTLAQFINSMELFGEKKLRGHSYEMLFSLLFKVDISEPELMKYCAIKRSKLLYLQKIIETDQKSELANRVIDEEIMKSLGRLDEAAKCRNAVAKEVIELQKILPKAEIFSYIKYYVLCFKKMYKKCNLNANANC